MAHMIPQTMEEDNNSFGEKQVFEALKKLPDEYTVFHSVRWNDRNEKNTVVYGECDFTIFHHRKGILVIEVKSGGIECVNNTWTYIRTDNGERNPMKNPLKQADKSKYKFIELLEQYFEDTQGTDAPQYCMVESAVWFPSVSRRDVIGILPMEYHPEIVLLENALESPQKFVDGIYDFYGGERHTRLDRTSEDDILDLFAPLYRVMPSLKSKKQEQQEAFDRLTREQASLLDYLEEQRVAAIQGATGTGKTWLAIEKAKRLADSGKVLFLCFNQFLRIFLQDLKNENPQKYKNIDFYNLPQLVCQKLKVPSAEREDILQFLENFDSYSWEYRHIIIDEGQDFHDGEIEKLYDIALLQDGSFYVFFDKNQFVQGKEFPVWLRNAECRLVLNINCRNTYSIADTSGKPVGVEPKVKNKGVKGDMPKFYICGNRDAALKQISLLIDQYRSNGYGYNQICILTVKTETMSIMQGVERLGVHSIKTARGNSSVLFTTARKFKGLESDAIIMIDEDAYTFSDPEYRRLFYVGASRAKHSLDIVFAGGNPELEAVVGAISDRKYPTPFIGIARTLNVKPISNQRA